MKKFIWRDESWNPVTSKVDKEPSVSRTQSNLQERDLSESSQWPRAVNYLRKKLYVRRLTGFWIRLWPRHCCLWTETHWVNILIQVTQLFIENIVPNFEKPSTNDMRNKRIPSKHVTAQSQQQRIKHALIKHNLIKHAMKWYSKWSTSNHPLSEEQRTKTDQWLQRNWSILRPSQDITLLLYPLISSRRDLVSDLSKHVCNFFFNSRWRNKLKSR